MELEQQQQQLGLLIEEGLESSSSPRAEAAAATATLPVTVTSPAAVVTVLPGRIRCRHIGFFAGTVLVVCCATLGAKDAGQFAATSKAIRLLEVWLPPASSPKALLQREPDHALSLDNTTLNRSKNLTEELQVAADWPPANLLHVGLNCWQACGNLSGDCAWCGLGNACCRYLSKDDPPECEGATYPSLKFHTCVVPANIYTVKHWQQDCFGPCNQTSGYCDWCGRGNACCRRASILYDAPECHGAVSFSADNEQYSCVSTVGTCPVGEVSDHKGGCRKPKSAHSMSFYMYKSTGPTRPDLNSTTLSSLGGTLWYLHNEVVQYCPRRYGIDRIRRYLVTIKPSDRLFEQTGQTFDSYAHFSKGKCMDEDCAENRWQKYGYNVGCRYPDKHNSFAYYRKAIWYSLPGSCPSKHYSSKTALCRSVEPGGRCKLPNGSNSCTWWAEEAGEIFLDELVGIPDYKTFCSAGNYEYDLATDSGVGPVSFWDSRLDAASCAYRDRKMHKLFQEKYPSMPASLAYSPCDS